MPFDSVHQSTNGVPQRNHGAVYRRMSLETICSALQKHFLLAFDIPFGTARDKSFSLVQVSFAPRASMQQNFTGRCGVVPAVPLPQ